MDAIISILFFISLISLIVGLIQPKVFNRFFKNTPTRKQVGLIFGITALILLFSIDGNDDQNIQPTVVKTINHQVSENKEEVPEEVGEIATTTEENIISEDANQESNQPVEQASDLYVVVSVVDGDTIKVNIDGTTETLRLIGIDTPETVDPRKPVQCYGIEASNRTKELLSGKKVRLEADPTQGERDKYGRLLRYVWMEDGVFFNKIMISDGYAYEYTYNKPYKYQAEFKAAQVEAQASKRGLWADGVCDEFVQDEPTETTPNTTESPSDNVVIVGKFYTSSHPSAKYYYPEDCTEWQGLSERYLKSFDTLEALLTAYSRSLSPQCQ